jgi:hypothetical protein
MVNSEINHRAHTDVYHLGLVVDHTCTQFAQHDSSTHYISTLKALQPLQLCSPSWSGSQSCSHCKGKKLGCSGVMWLGIVRNQRKESPLKQRLFGKDLQSFLLNSVQACSRSLGMNQTNFQKQKSAVWGWNAMMFGANKPLECAHCAWIRIIRGYFGHLRHWMVHFVLQNCDICDLCIKVDLRLNWVQWYLVDCTQDGPVWWHYKAKSFVFSGIVPPVPKF